MSEWIVTYDDDGEELVKGQIVRCKDCVHYRESYKNGSGDCIYCNRHIFVVEDDYCSCGERREVTE